MQLSLIVTDGKHAGRSVRVKGSKFTIGRSSECDLRAKSSQISRRHCVIEVKSKEIIVRDLRSRNGTFVNGEEIDEKQALNNGDRLTVGRFELEVKITDDAKAAKSSSKRAKKESQDTAKAAAEAAGISGIALSIMEEVVEASDDDFELIGKSADSQASGDLNGDAPTQSFTWPKDQQASSEQEATESDEEDDPSKKSHDPSKYVVTEADKQKARNERAIVGASKATQDKRTAATSHEAAEEALRRFRR